MKCSLISYDAHFGVISQLCFWRNERRIGKALQTDEDGHRYQVCLLQRVPNILSSTVVKHYAQYPNLIHAQRECNYKNNGLATLTDWIVTECDVVQWRNNKKASKAGFMFVRLKHHTKPIKFVVYNVYSPVDCIEKVAADNFRQLADHVLSHASNDPVIIGGNFNWRHRWRPLDSRVDEGVIDVTYNAGFKDDIVRYDPFEELLKINFVDTEMLIKRTHNWSSSTNKWFIRNGKDTSIIVEHTRKKPACLYCNFVPLSENHSNRRVQESKSL